MTTATNPLKAQLDKANQNTLPDLLRKVQIGQVLRGQITQVLRKKDPAPDAAQLATVESIVLPNDAKAAVILRATVRAGGVTGELAVQAYGTTPSTGQIAVAPNGDIAVLAADLITDMDVVYVPERGDVVTVTADVATGVLTIPAPYVSRGVIALLDANATVGTVTGRKKILVPAAGLPATTKAQLNLAKSTVSFNNATDAVTKATVTLLLAAAIDLDAELERESTIM